MVVRESGCIVMNVSVVFFFQAEDGIRDSSVTGVQTCALPIYVAGSLRCITGDHQALVDTKVHRDHNREGEQVEESRDSCSFALRLVYGAGRHSVPPRNPTKLCA